MSPVRPVTRSAICAPSDCPDPQSSPTTGVSERAATAVAETTLDLLILQPTPLCNLNCDYCYLPDRLNAARMSDRVLRSALDIVLASGLVDTQLSIAWHAGEPTTLPVHYFENAFAIVAKAARGTVVHHSLQTNATRLDDEWCRFFERHDVRVGVSVDGPDWLHDTHRLHRSGRGSHRGVMRGIEALKTHKIPFHAIAVVTSSSLAHPEEVFDFFRTLGCERVGFNFEETESMNARSSLADQSAGSPRTFLERIYDLNEAAGFPLSIREFTGALEALTTTDLASRNNTPLGQQNRPLSILSVGFDGALSTYSPELLGARAGSYESFAFGNVLRDDLVDLMANHSFRTLSAEIARGIEMCAATCGYYAFCGGGAPANKLFENGTCASTETMYCRNAIQLPIDIVLARLERELSCAPELLEENE
jgi:uncharacterized protein